MEAGIPLIRWAAVDGNGASLAAGATSLPSLRFHKASDRLITCSATLDHVSPSYRCLL